MVVNAKCNACKETTKYVAGFFDGPKDRHGCLFDCKNEQCEIYQVKRFTESEAVKERIKIQNLNSQKGMYAGYIAALRKDAKITMMKMSQIALLLSAWYLATCRKQSLYTAHSVLTSNNAILLRLLSCDDIECLFEDCQFSFCLGRSLE